jgi:hypothetical protein
VAEPALAPVTTPDVLFTVAIEPFEELHVPFAEALAKVVVVPLQMLVVPVMLAGVVFTFNAFVEIQPLLV